MDEKPYPELAITYKKSSKRPGGILFLVFLLIGVLVLLFLAFRFLNLEEFIPFQNQPTPTVVPTKSAPTSTPAPDEASPSPEPTEAEELDRADLTVAVQNGSGVKGAAGKLSAYLEELGYAIGTVGNADAFDYTGVTIRVKAGKADYLPLLQKDVEEEYEVASATKDLPAGNAADAVVIYGAEE